MQGLGPSTVLGGRYALAHRLFQGRDLERWAAHDTTLEREVTLTIVGSNNPNRAGVLDAARRAAGVEDARLVRILDVGTLDDSSFIVEEALVGSQSLATMLLQGPLPAEEARRVAGETARGLETAGRRGLHHLRLTPHHVMVGPDGAVRVTGVAVAAAISRPGQQEPDAPTAARQDALSLVAVVYAAMTGRWPLDEQLSGVESAPRTAEGAVAPSEIAAGVPPDLNDLCRLTLNESTGPLTPAEFADRIAPWPHEQVRRAAVEPTMVLQLPGTAEATDESDAVEGDAVEGDAVEGDAVEGDAVESDAGEGDAGHAHTSDGVDTTETLLVQDRAEPPGMGHANDPSFAPTGEKSAPADVAEGRHDSRTPSGLESHFVDAEPPLPLLPASTAQPPSRGQSKVVVAVVATFLALAMFLGFRGLFGTAADNSPNKPAARRTAAVAKPSVTATSQPSQAPQAAGPVAILSATGFDPQGDNTERNSQVARIYDGDLSTSWSTERYGTADFGNLKKGVGVLLDLGQPTSVRRVTITLGNGPVDVTAYAAPDPSLNGATEIGSATGADGLVRLKAADTMPKAQYVIIWFTKLAQDGSQFRASISEVALS